METVSLPDVATLKTALQNARALPLEHLLREHQIAAMEHKQQLYIDQLVLEAVPETDLRIIELRSM